MTGGSILPRRALTCLQRLRIFLKLSCSPMTSTSKLTTTFLKIFHFVVPRPAGGTGHEVYRSNG